MPSSNRWLGGPPGKRRCWTPSSFGLQWLTLWGCAWCGTDLGVLHVFGALGAASTSASPMSSGCAVRHRPRHLPCLRCLRCGIDFGVFDVSWCSVRHQFRRLLRLRCARRDIDQPRAVPLASPFPPPPGDVLFLAELARRGAMAVGLAAQARTLLARDFWTLMDFETVGPMDFVNGVFCVFGVLDEAWTSAVYLFGVLGAASTSASSSLGCSVRHRHRHRLRLRRARSGIDFGVLRLRGARCDIDFGVFHIFGVLGAASTSAFSTSSGFSVRRPLHPRCARCDIDLGATSSVRLRRRCPLRLRCAWCGIYFGVFYVLGVLGAASTSTFSTSSVCSVRHRPRRLTSSVCSVWHRLRRLRLRGARWGIDFGVSYEWMA